MQTVLVTGGAGYIGSHTCHMLIENGYNVIVIDSLENGHREHLPEQVRFYKEDLNNFEKINTIFEGNEIDAVIHFAGYIEAGESMQDPIKFFQNNVSNSINLIKAMKNNNVRNIVFSSSAGVYGQPEEMPIKETAKKKPTNYYGLTKLMFEQILDSAKVYNMQSICLRYFNAAGAGYNIGEKHNPETHLIPLILQVATGERNNIKIFGTDYPTPDGTCIRDYIHVLDLAKAHIKALHLLDRNIKGKFNVGTGKGNSVKEIINICREVTQHPIPAEECPRREGDPPELVADSNKFKEFDWQPEHSIRDIIQSAWDWHSLQKQT
jgi:UDP-glucose 4-epimerase